MAVLDKMPDRATIDAFHGKLDFYFWRGLPVCRKWPHYPPRTPTTSESANQQDFAYISSLAPELSNQEIMGYKYYAKSTPWTWKDMLVKSYMGGAFW